MGGSIPSAPPTNMCTPLALDSQHEPPSVTVPLCHRGTRRGGHPGVRGSPGPECPTRRPTTRRHRPPSHPESGGNAPLAPVSGHAQDAGGAARRSEAILLARLCADYSFPCQDDAPELLPLLSGHLELRLREDDAGAWKAVATSFGRAQPWAVRSPPGRREREG